MSEIDPLALVETPLVDDAGGSIVVASGDYLVIGGGNQTLEPRVGSAPEGLVVDLCSGWSKIGEAPSATLNAVVRHLAPGDWRLEGAIAGLDLQADASIVDVDTVRVVREEDRRVLFSGWVLPVDDATGGLEELDGGDDGPRFVLTGPDAWEPLMRRIAYPVPEAEPPWSLSHNERTGVASTVAAAYLAANLGDDALPARQYGDVTIIDGEVGASSTWTARLQRLDVLIARVCRDGGITCRPSVGFDGGLRVVLGAPRDSSARIVLSDQGDLTEYRRRTVPASATYVIAGGQGELTDRLFAVSTSGVSGRDRREVFADWSNLASATEVSRAALTTRRQSAATWSVQAAIADVAAQRLRFLDDYDIGDLLSVEINSIRHAVPIEAVRIELDASHGVIRPVFGTAAPDLLAGLLRDVAGLRSRLDSTIT